MLKKLILVLALAVCNSSDANYRPISVEQPAGRWYLVHRPTVIGELFWGPLWVFIPNPSPTPTIMAPQQNPLFFQPTPQR